MKKFFTLIILSAFTLPAISQILVMQDFSSYDGTPSSVPPGWVISWNDTTANSFYSGTTTCGVSCPAYKFGIDSAYIITPAFAGADSVRFYMKGNGSAQPNRFQVYGGPDTMNWTLIRSFDTITTTAQTVTLPVQPSFTNLKFIYIKDSLGLNVGLDDVFIFAGTFTSIGAVETISASIYPNPTNGMLNVDYGSRNTNEVMITVNDILGKQVKQIQMNNRASRYHFDLSDLENGVYTIRVNSDFGVSTRRIVLRK